MENFMVIVKQGAMIAIITKMVVMKIVENLVTINFWGKNMDILRSFWLKVIIIFSKMQRKEGSRKRRISGMTLRVVKHRFTVLLLSWELSELTEAGVKLKIGFRTEEVETFDLIIVMWCLSEVVAEAIEEAMGWEL